MKYWILLVISLASLSVFASEKDIDKACKKYKATDCNLVKAIAWIENNYKNRHVIDSGTMSYGPLQIKCAAARDAGLKYSCKQLRNKWVALRFGIKYLQMKVDKYSDLNDAIVSYNSGSPVVCKNYNPGKCYPGEYINQKYLIKVMRHYNYLKGSQEWTDLKLLQLTSTETPVFHMQYMKPCTVSQKILPIYQSTMTSWKF
jgi:hypothetical protein